MAETPYRVLARAYRPKILSDLKGQDALVQTLTHAIESSQLAQAYLLTGIRGVGKTTTARIIARSLLCVGSDGKGGMTTAPCGVCSECKSLSDDRHPDVIEMDAASHTGVQDVRDLIETVHYRPIQGRKKIIILDEVHMLSGNAFNALLKTLEEPPEHVLFIFATTESRKIPMTIRSRCQHFALHRLTTEELASHLAWVSEKENVALSPEAATLLASAAGGSVRDSLSLLDQAMIYAHKDKKTAIDDTSVRKMLGMGDSLQLVDLLGYILQGEAKSAIEKFRTLYMQGMDGMVLLDRLLHMVHVANCLLAKIPVGADTSEAEAKALKKLLEHCSVPSLTRLWQMILKGQQELRSTDHIQMALEMLMVRMAYVSDLPTFDQLKGLTPVQAQQEALAPKVDAKPAIDSFKAVVELCRTKQEMRLYHHLREDAHLVSFEPGKIVLRVTDVVPETFSSQLRNALRQWTEQPWQVDLSSEEGSDTLKTKADKATEIKKGKASKDPSVKPVLEAFPGATVTEVKEG